MNYCPQCGHQLSQNQKFCPECGCNLSLQPKFANEYETVCPDCGKVFKETIPDACPNCGCPSSEFHHNEKENNEVAELGSEKIKQFLVLLVIISIVCGVGYVLYSSAPKNSNNTSSSSSHQDYTTQTVYKGSSGNEIILYDDGRAYINGRRGSWTQSYVRLGSNSHEFIKIRQNGMISEGGIFKGKFYYGRNVEMAIKENYPDGEPVRSSRK